MASVDLFWLPLGAGPSGQCVRFNGRVFEGISSFLSRRNANDLYHSALDVRVDSGAYVIEMTPVWQSRQEDRGVQLEGPVGLRVLGRSRLFRYEVRCWRSGVIPDVAEAADSPQRMSDDPDMALHVLKLVAECPPVTWGRDELRTGEMWNSNSLVSWLLARSGHDLGRAQMPANGRAPGWNAGLVVAARQRAVAGIRGAS